MSQVVVSTECPSCGGPLDFSEGANAIRCPSCRSTLLVTGRKQVLSYWVAPKVKAEVAGAAARTGRIEARVARTELYFVPFYRLTGHDFQWQDAPPRPAPEPGVFSLGGAGGSDPAELDLPVGSMLSWSADVLLGKRAGNVVRDLLGENRPPPRTLEQAVLTVPRAAPAPSLERSVQFLDRYVEKTFPAADLPGLGAFSLGVRTQALRISLFQRDALAALGKVVAVQVSQDAAMTQGLAAPGFEHVVYRQVLGRILSVIYFPFWVVELSQGGQEWLTIVDGVAESVIQPRAPLALYEALGRTATNDPLTVGFRPLVCPNCGWDLPVEPDDVIFCCTSCQRTWQIHGAEMAEIPHEIATPSTADQTTGTSGAPLYLPFWQLASSAGAGSHVWEPAFRYRRLKVLHDLGLRLSTKTPAYTPWAGECPTLRGCFYDAADATLLARFTAAGERRTPEAVKVAAAAEPIFEAPRLTWIPFKRESQSLVDPFTGLALQEALLG